MRFDNAFLTKNGKVGMQFEENKAIITIYPDAKGNLVCSEHCTAEQKAKLVTQYMRRRSWYKK